MNRLAPLMAIHAEKQSTFVSRLRYWALLLLTVGLLQATTAQAQTINTIAGNGTTAYNGEDENGTDDNATAVSLYSPRKAAPAISATGDLYIADSSHNRIRKVSSTGVITTVAGNGTAGSGGDGGPATSASLNYPTSVVIDSKNNLYIADNQNHRIRKVSASDGSISTVAGNGTQSTDSQAPNGDGGAATSASLNTPVSVALDSTGATLYIVDKNNQRIRKVIIGGNITTVAGTGVAGYGGDGGVATSAMLNFPFDVAVDTSGNLFIADTTNQLIRKVTAVTDTGGGIISTVAGNGGKTFTGDGGLATEASLNNPAGITVDANGNLYIADTSNQRIRQVQGNDGIINTVVGNGTKAFGGDGGAPIDASLNNPYGITVDAQSNLYIADTSNQRVRKVTPLFTTTTTALTSTPNPATYYGDDAVQLTATVTGNNPLGSVTFLTDGTSVVAGCEAVSLASTTSNEKTALCLLAHDLSVGTHTYIATYSGDYRTASSTSEQLTQTVNKAVTRTQVMSYKNPATYGDELLFSALVISDGYPSGTVTFKDGGVTIAGCDAARLSTDFDTYNPPIAFCYTSTLIAGSHSITAVYKGNTSYTESTSAALAQTINKKTTSTALTSSASEVAYGSPVTFTATVNGTNPTGNVTFKDNGQALSACATVTLSNTQASCSYSFAKGSHSITATYNGDNNNVTSISSAVSLTVKAATTTALTSSASEMVYGNPVSFTATIKNGDSPTGTITFKDKGQTFLHCSAVTVSNAQAICNYSYFSKGTHEITATYNGDGTNATSTSNVVYLKVNESGTTTSTTISSSVNPSIYGNPVTFTATVNGRSPTGTVRFSDGSTIIPGCEAVSLSYSGSGDSSKTTCKTSNLSVGSHSIQGSYSGDADDKYSYSAVYSMQVNATSPLTISLTSPDEGMEFPTSAKINMVASVSGGSAPIKQVDFYANGIKIGTDTTSPYSYMTSKLANGSHTLKAKAIDTNGSSKTSDSVTITVCYECY